MVLQVCSRIYHLSEVGFIKTDLLNYATGTLILNLLMITRYRPRFIHALNDTVSSVCSCAFESYVVYSCYFSSEVFFEEYC